MSTSPHTDCLYHITQARKLAWIALDGLVPSIGDRSRLANEVRPWVHCFTSFEAVEKELKRDDVADRYGRHEKLALLAVNLSPKGADPVECAYGVTLKPHLLWVVTDEIHADSDFSALRARECLMIGDYMKSRVIQAAYDFLTDQHASRQLNGPADDSSRYRKVVADLATEVARRRDRQATRDGTDSQQMYNTMRATYDYLLDHETRERLDRSGAESDRYGTIALELGSVLDPSTLKTSTLVAPDSTADELSNGVTVLR